MKNLLGVRFSLGIAFKIFNLCSHTSTFPLPDVATFLCCCFDSFCDVLGPDSKLILTSQPAARQELQQEQQQLSATQIPICLRQSCLLCGQPNK